MHNNQESVYKNEYVKKFSPIHIPQTFPQYSVISSVTPLIFL